MSEKSERAPRKNKRRIAIAVAAVAMTAAAAVAGIAGAGRHHGTAPKVPRPAGVSAPATPNTAPMPASANTMHPVTNAEANAAFQDTSKNVAKTIIADIATDYKQGKHGAMQYNGNQVGRFPGIRNTDTTPEAFATYTPNKNGKGGDLYVASIVGEDQFDNVEVDMKVTGAEAQKLNAKVGEHKQLSVTDFTDVMSNYKDLTVLSATEQSASGPYRQATMTFSGNRLTESVLSDDGIQTINAGVHPHSTGSPLVNAFNGDMRAVANRIHEASEPK